VDRRDERFDTTGGLFSLKWFRIALCIVLVGGIAVAGGWFYAAHRERPEAVRKECIIRLETLGRALEKYASENEGLLPGRLTDLYPGYIESLKLCERPVSSGSGSPKGYSYDSRAKPDTDFVALVVYDPPGSHEETAMGAHAAGMRNGKFVGITTYSDDEITMLGTVQDHAFDYVTNDSQAALQALLGIMNESEGHVRDAAADVLRIAAKPQTTKLLVGELAREDVQAEAEKVLAGIGTGALSELIEACDDPNPSVRASAVRSLGEIGDPSAVSVVFGKLADVDPDVRDAATSSLGKMPPARVVSVLTNAVTRGELMQEQIILDALPRIGESLVPQLTAMLERGDKASRGGAAFLLGKLKAETAVPALARATEDADWAVAMDAARALVEIGNQDALGHLVALLDRPLSEEGMPDLHRMAVAGLGTVGGEQARTKLREVLARTTEPYEVRSDAAYYLGQLQDREAVPLLIETMREYYYLRPVIAEALRGITGQNLGVRPDEWKNWWNSAPQPPPLYQNPVVTPPISGSPRPAAGTVASPQ
jgi:HEAT repeat protein